MTQKEREEMLEELKEWIAINPLAGKFINHFATLLTIEDIEERLSFFSFEHKNEDYVDGFVDALDAIDTIIEQYKLDTISTFLLEE